METEIPPLYGTGECDGAGSCVLPVNANIELQYKGAGGLTDAVVSIDVYPKNQTVDPVRAIRHQDYTIGASVNYVYTKIRVVFPAGFDVCDSVIGVQGNMSGVTIRKYGSNETRNLRFYKAGSTVTTARGTTEPSLAIQKAAPTAIPRTGLLRLPPSVFPAIRIDHVVTLTTSLCRRSVRPSRPAV